MHLKSSVMQRARFLNKAKDKNIKKIILFGSLTDNTYTALSDADLLIILEKSELRFIDRIPEFIFYFLDAPVSVDVFPYTEEEVKKVKLAKNAISKGSLLA